MYPKLYKTNTAIVEAMQMSAVEDEIIAMFKWIESSKKNLAFLWRGGKELNLDVDGSIVFPGMWVVKESTGEFRILSPGEFNALYQPMF